MRARQTAGEPFFCYLPTNTPHGPNWVAEKYAAPYRKQGLPADYYGMIANLDENLGRLEDFLKETGLRDNTLLVFMTDNGATAGQRVYNAGMREGKTTVYEGGHRVPCFVRWPAGRLRAPGDIGAPAEIQDILPTLTGLLGLKVPEQAKFDGTSLAGLLKGTATSLPDRTLVVQYGQILKKWDCAVIWNKWRLVKGEELYDVKADPGQRENLSSRHADVLARMRAYYEKWWAEIEPTLDDYCPLSIGSPEENPVRLTSSDWQDIYCDNTNCVREAGGGAQGGHWNVRVEKDGEYEIALRRWPADTDLALTAAMPSQQMTAGTLPAGKALPIAAARLRVAGQDLARKAAPTDKAAVFRVRLRAGAKAQLHGWFQDQSGKDLCGAYYAYVKRL